MFFFFLILIFNIFSVIGYSPLPSDVVRLYCILVAVWPVLHL